MALDPVKNFAKVLVSTGYDADDTSIVLETDEGAKLPAPATDGAFNVVWYNSSDYGDPGDDPNVEIVRVTARSTDTLTITREQEGTTAKTHNTAGKVYKMILAMTKKMIDDIPNLPKIWTAITATRVSNTTATVTGDQTAIFKKGMIIRWQESGVDKVAMVSIPSTYSSPNTTITIIGDTCASIDTDTFKYSVILGAEPYIAKFAYAGTVGAVADDVMNAYYATEPMRVLGADLQAGTAGTTNATTIDIDKATTTMFTTKPTLATTVASSPTPFTADDNTSLALGDRVRINIDAVQTTAAIDLYVQLYLFPTRFLTLS